MDPASFSELGAWLTEAGLAGKSETELLDGLCRRGLEAGLAIARAIMIIDTLHPVHEGRAFFGAEKPGRRRPNWSNTARAAKAKRPRTGAAAFFSTCSRPADRCFGCVFTPAKTPISRPSRRCATKG
jgi:hypothetical protein